MSLIISNKEKYRAFCEQEKSLPLFLQAWWMDAVCKENDRWEAFLYEEKDEIKGVFVCYFVKKYGVRMVIQPQLTQYNGIWLKYDDSLENNEKLSFEKKAINNLLTQLNEAGFDYFNQNFPLNFTNWLPFHWQNFQQSTRYTYQIQEIKSIDAVFEKFSYAKQKQVKKAEKNLRISHQMSGEEFYNHLADYQKSRKNEVNFTKSFFINLYTACRERNQGEIIAVEDESNVIHAALFVVWDNKTAYNLISTIHPLHKDSGASTFVVFEAIKFLSDKVEVFDFEGSMDEGIENSFSQFGTEQVPYFQIKKYQSFAAKHILPLFKL